MRVAVPAISFGQHLGLVKLLRERYPDCKVNTEGVPHYRSEQATIDYLRGYDAAIVSFEPINERVLGELPDLKVIAKLGVGLDKIDPAAMRRHGVRLGWTPGVNKRSVAELALCMAIAALRHVVDLNAAMRRARAAAATHGAAIDRPRRRDPRLWRNRQGARAAAGTVRLHRARLRHQRLS